MRLTVAELAIATGKSQNYVRQHINRRHLTVQREGRNVFVELDEAARWAHDRGMPLDLPAHSTLSMEAVERRVARMTILTWRPKGSRPINLFTLIRHRRREPLGPWAREPNQTWSSEVVLTDYASESEEFRLYVLETTLHDCQELVDAILAEGTLEVPEGWIDYSLESLPRHHWAYRDERQDMEPSFRSPFTKHSARVTEYWSFADGHPKRWLKVAESPHVNVENLEKRLGFPIAQLPDRVGNLVIAGAEDTLHCELSAHSEGKALILNVDNVDAGELPPNTYTAAVWASHSGDDVARCEVPIAQRETIVDLQSDVDRIGFAIYRNVDGQCIDLMDAYLIMGVSIAMNIESGATLEVRDRRSRKATKFSPWRSRSVLNIEPDENSATLDKQIRREVLNRRSFRREMAARREDGFGRFGPDQFDDAVEFFIGLLHRHTYSTEPIYIADPFFMGVVPGSPESQLYLRMFEATTGRRLHILGSAKQRTTPVKPWWSSYPSILTNHVIVRELLTQSGYDTVFHDRFLITHDREILMSNSFNGWRKDGVTFVSLPYGVYRIEAEKWWSLGLGKTPDGILVYEVK